GFCGSAGIGAVLTAQDQASACGVQLRLALPPSGPVRSLFELLGLDQKLPIYPSLGQALAAREAPSAQVIYLRSRRRRSLPAHQPERGSGARPAQPQRTPMESSAARLACTDATARNASRR